MELIFPVLSSTLSYFFLAYFIYIISGRKKKLTKGIIYVFGLIMIYQNIIRPWSLLSNAGKFYAFALSLIPPLLALAILYYLMGDLNFFQFKSKKSKLKSFKDVKDTVYYQMKFVYLAIFVPLLLSAIAIYAFDSVLLYATLILSFGVFIYGIISYIKLKPIKEEYLVLFIGKEKENIYLHMLQRKTKHIDIKNYFKNNQYLIDHIGYIDLLKDSHVSRHHLYWIGTSNKIIVEDPTWKKIDKLPYQNDIFLFEKYHYIYLKYELVDEHVKQIYHRRIK